MNIQLVSTKAVAVDLAPIDNEVAYEVDENMSFSFDFNPMVDDSESSDSLIVAFFGEMKNLKEKYECKVVFIAKFEVDQPITQDFLRDSFALINAPAIGYPYFRAFYSNFLLSAGYEPKILPTINFVQLRKDKLKDMENRT